jgi:hypothetical protein
MISVACPAAHTCVATGTYTDSLGDQPGFADVWHSGHWLVTPFQQADVFSPVDCPSAVDCVALGGGGSRNGYASIETWNGGSWIERYRKLLPVPADGQPGTGFLTAFACAGSPYTCTGVGGYWTPTGTVRYYALRRRVP